MVESRENLYEVESFQMQCLDQFREWIEKETRIQKCCMDTKFLLKFLRVKNFSIADAFRVFVNYYSARKSIPYMFENLDPTDPDIDLMISNGNALILPEVDVHGCPVVLQQFCNIDLTRSTIFHYSRMCNLIAEIVSCDPRSQINGITHIMDCKEVTLEILALLTPKRLKEFAQCWQNTLPYRQRAIYFVNMGPILTPVFNIFKTLLSEKLRSRIKVFTGWEAIQQEIGGASILPRECGGKIPQEELVRAFKIKAREHREEILALDDYQVELHRDEVNFASAVDRELDSTIVGSFRKLEVD